MLAIVKTGPGCGSQELVSKGHDVKNGKQKYHCKSCGKYGTLDAAPGYSEERKAEILKVYFERPSMRGIARTFGVARQTLAGWLKEDGESSAGSVKPAFMLPNTMDGKFKETFSDLIHFVERSYRVSSKKESRAIAGLPMGGYHTSYISRYYPNTFDYMGLFSPALNNKPEDHPIDQNLKMQLDNGYKLYWIGIGKMIFLFYTMLLKPTEQSWMQWV
jgi:transposase-like protein